MGGNPIGETMVPAWPSSQSRYHTRYSRFEKGSGLKVHHPMMKMKMKMIHPSASSWRHKVENTMMLVCFWKVTCSWGSWFRLLAVSTYSKDLIYHDWNIIITHAISNEGICHIEARKHLEPFQLQDLKANWITPGCNWTCIYLYILWYIMYITL